MDINMNKVVTITTLLSIIVYTQCSHDEVNKPGRKFKICGNDISTAIMDCCLNGYPECIPKTGDSGELNPDDGNVDFLQRKKRGSPLMHPKIAKSFMGALRKRAWGETGVPELQINPVEECCDEQEGCSYEEIHEYSSKPELCAKLLGKK